MEAAFWPFRRIAPALASVKTQEPDRTFWDLGRRSSYLPLLDLCVQLPNADRKKHPLPWNGAQQATPAYSSPLGFPVSGSSAFQEFGGDSFGSVCLKLPSLSSSFGGSGAIYRIREPFAGVAHTKHLAFSKTTRERTHLIDMEGCGRFTSSIFSLTPTPSSTIVLNKTATTETRWITIIPPWLL